MPGLNETLITVIRLLLSGSLLAIRRGSKEGSAIRRGSREGSARTVKLKWS